MRASEQTDLAITTDKVRENKIRVENVPKAKDERIKATLSGKLQYA